MHTLLYEKQKISRKKLSPSMYRHQHASMMYKWDISMLYISSWHKHPILVQMYLPLYVLWRYMYMDGLICVYLPYTVLSHSWIKKLNKNTYTGYIITCTKKIIQSWKCVKLTLCGRNNRSITLWIYTCISGSLHITFWKFAFWNYHFNIYFVSQLLLQVMCL